MITLTRRQLLALRPVFHHRVLGIANWMATPPVAFRADPRAGLRVRHRAGVQAVECLIPGPPRPAETILLPFRDLRILAAPEDSPVTLERRPPRGTLVRWADPRPMDMLHQMPRPRSLPRFPDLPAAMHPAPGGLLDALAQASRSCVRVRVEAAAGELVVDGDIRVPLADGYEPPWEGEVAVAASRVPARRELPRDGLLVGRAGGWVALRAGAWTLWLAELDEEGDPTAPTV